MPEGRFAFLDFYRGVIILLMIEGHVVRELLEPALRTSTIFRVHEFFHGITGPGFLFGAGITFGIAAQRRWGEYLAFTPILRRRLRRIVLLLGLGYMLHLPFFSLWKTLVETSPEAWQSFLSFDVLQCIGGSLLILQCLVFIVRRERWFAGATLILTVTVVYATPLVWVTEGMYRLPQAVAMALQGNEGSVYPLFPNSAFLFGGAFASYEFVKFAQQGRPEAFVRRLAMTGVACSVAGVGLEALPVSVYPAVDFWRTSPNFFLIRLGGILLLMSGAWYAVQQSASGGAALQWVLLLGVESLFVYIVHLLVLYGSILNPATSISAAWAGEHSWGLALLAAAIVTGVLALSARGWNLLKNRHPVLLKGIVWWMGVVFLYEFATRLY